MVSLKGLPPKSEVWILEIKNIGRRTLDDPISGTDPIRQVSYGVTIIRRPTLHLSGTQSVGTKRDIIHEIFIKLSS